MTARHDGALLEALRPLLRRVRTTDSAIKKTAGGKTIMAWTDEPIGPAPEGRERLLQHLNGGPYRGASPMQYSSSSTMVSLYDLDSHGGEIPWPEMLAVARRLMEAMRLHGLEPVAFRSSGGKGIHIYCLWEEGQDAYSVRELMKAILLQLGYKEGAGGVKKREIEIFPKRDSMGEKKTVIRKGKPHVTRGGQFILPLAAESVPLDPVTLAVLPRTPESIKWPMSKPVNVLAKPERRPRHEGDPSMELDKLRSALAAIPDEAPEIEEYDLWLKMLAAIHYETRGSAEGLELAHEFSARASNYDPDALDDKWDSFDDERENPVTGGTIIYAARTHGWDFNDDSMGAAIERLAKLDPLQYDRVRKAEAKALEVRAETLDAEVAATRKRMGLDADGGDGKQGKPIEFEEVEPWPSPVDGARLLDDLASTLGRFIVLPPHGAEAMALWIVFTHLLDAAGHAPLLVISSPVKRCGKTTAFDLLTRLVHHPLPTSSITAPALFRIVEAYAPCILFDEVDALLERDQTGDMRGIINAGHSPATAHVIRTVGDDHEPRRFSVWAPKALALIGSLEKKWSTVADRAVVVPMQRKPPSTRLPSLRTGKEEFAALRRRIVRWADDHVAGLQGAEPDTPESLNDRAADNWRVLFAIADAAGGGWPERARKAALALSGDGGESVTVDDGASVRLLSDARDIFARSGADRIASDDLVNKLNALEDADAPWPEWNARHPFTGIGARDVARLLKPYGIFSGSIRLPDGKTPKGYKLADFADAFERYLPPKSETVEGEETVDPEQVDW